MARTVHTSVVKKSAANRARQWARKNVRHVMGRSRLGGMPCSFPTAEALTDDGETPTFVVTQPHPSPMQLRFQDALSAHLVGDSAGVAVTANSSW
jgi:hypothetical protein